MSAAEIRNHLNLLRLERLEADSVGLSDCELFERDLDEEIATYRSAFIGASVTEIALLRAELSGCQVG